MSHGIAEIGPQAAWELLKTDSGARLVDVRTRAEWSFVGVPDLAQLDRQTVLVEWKSFPQMARNENFVTDLQAAISDGPATQLLFICRSGARSLRTG